MKLYPTIPIGNVNLHANCLWECFRYLLKVKKLMQLRKECLRVASNVTKPTMTSLA